MLLSRWLRLFYHIHRLLGTLGAMMLLPMAVTGLLLRHQGLLGYESEWAERVQLWIFQVHSGQARGPVAWLPDLAAICAISLSLSGLGIASSRAERALTRLHPPGARKRATIWIIRRGA